MRSLTRSMMSTALHDLTLSMLGKKTADDISKYLPQKTSIPIHAVSWYSLKLNPRHIK